MNARLLMPAFAALLCVAGCAKVKNSLSISSSTPDEFSVVGSQPLAMPPEFRLNAPGEDTPASRMRASSSRLTPSMLRGEGGRSGGASRSRATDGENRFLGRIGADGANASVRRELQDGIEPEKQESILPTLGGSGESSSVVDAGAERARIKKIRDEGGQVSGEGAATHEESDRGVLGKWLGR